MKKFNKQVLVSITVAVFSAATYSQTTPTQTLGELLYSTHCVTCHTTQMHWRNNRQANDWDSLKFQVRRWQGNTGLAWSEVDITEVSRYLNETIYRYPTPADRVGLITKPTPPSSQQTHRGQ